VQDSNAPIMPAQVDAALVPAPVIPWALCRWRRRTLSARAF